MDSVAAVGAMGVEQRHELVREGRRLLWNAVRPQASAKIGQMQGLQFPG